MVATYEMRTDGGSALSALAGEAARLRVSLSSEEQTVTVIDGHPATLAWLGSVAGNRTRSLGVEHFVVVHCAPDIDIRPERQRRLCLGRLVPELAELGVTRVIAESRGRADDRRDAQAVEHLRQSRRLSGPFHIDHARGPFDPLLWVPDACCGVITRHRCGDSTHYEKLSTQITMCEVES